MTTRDPQRAKAKRLRRAAKQKAQLERALKDREIDEKYGHGMAADLRAWGRTERE